MELVDQRIDTDDIHRTWKVVHEERRGALSRLRASKGRKGQKQSQGERAVLRLLEIIQGHSAICIYAPCSAEQ
jgi:hypothetical protein